MPFDGSLPTVRHTRASALALYEAAGHTGGWQDAAHALAEVLATPAKRSQAAPDGLTAGAVTAALRLVLRAMPSGSVNINALRCVLISADGERLTFRGTDLDSDLTVWTPAFGLILAPALIPARDFLAVVAKLPKDSRVELGTERGPDFEREWRDSDRQKRVETVYLTSLTVVAESGATWGIKGEWPRDFPALICRGEPLSVHMGAAEFRAALDFAAVSVSTEETRYYLNGVAFGRVGGNVPAFVSTDGHRLHKHEVAADMPAGFRTIIIPRLAVDLIRKLTLGPAVSLDVHAAQTVALDFPNGRLVSKLIDGSFPDVERVIPADPPVKVRFDREAFAAAVAQVGAVNASTRERCVRLTFGRDVCHISAKNMDGGAAERAMPCDFPGHGFELGVNARYLLEALAQLGGDVVTLGFGRGGVVLDPILITDADASRLAILMPLRA